MFRFLVVPILILIFGLPVLLVALPAIIWPVLPVWIATLLLGPLAYAALFVTTAGVLSLPFQKAIIPGKFPRDLSHPIYGRRRLYGLCWTSVYYHKPVYYLCLTIPLLKWLTFRLFGYRGSMDFTVYPDTWIRDLPLLDFGPGAYVSNRATLGTNMALSNGKILVGKIRLGKGALFGHLTVVGPGLVMGDGSEIGAASVLGSRIEIGEGSFVGQFSGVNHHVKIGAHSVIGGHSHIEVRAIIGPDLELPAGTCVPSRSKIMTKSDVSDLLSTQNSSLPRLRHELSRFDPGITAGEAQESRHAEQTSNHEKE